VSDNQVYSYKEDNFKDETYVPCFKVNDVDYYQNVLKIRKQYLHLIKMDKIEPEVSSDYHSPKEDLIVMLSTMLKILSNGPRIKVEDIAYGISDFWSLIKGMKLTSGPSDFMQNWQDSAILFKENPMSIFWN
jgi:hypothetical protein